MRKINDNHLIPYKILDTLEEGQVFINGTFKLMKKNNWFQLYIKTDDGWVFLYHAPTKEEIISAEHGFIFGVFLSNEYEIETNV